MIIIRITRFSMKNLFDKIYLTKFMFRCKFFPVNWVWVKDSKG